MRYVRLADFQVSNTLVTLVSDSAMLLLKAVTPATRTENVIRVKGDEDKLAIPVKGEAIVKPLFEVSVMFDDAAVLRVRPTLES